MNLDCRYPTRAASPRPQVTVLVGRDAAYARVLRELRGGRFDVVHFSGASHFDDSGSHLLLHDGKVQASELVTLLIKRPPSLLVMNAVYTGFVPVFCEAFAVPLQVGSSFDDHYRALRRHRIGLERAAARAGVGSFVGVMGRTMDDAAGRVGQVLHERLLAGRTVAEALWDARRAAMKMPGAGRPESFDTTPLQFAMSGYADLRLVRSPGPTRRKRAPARKPASS